MQIPAQRKAIAKAAAGKAKKGAPAPDSKVVAAEVYIREEFTGWQRTVLEVMKGCYDPAAKSFAEDLEAKVRTSSAAAWLQWWGADVASGCR